MTMTMTKEKSNFFCVSVHISACHVCVYVLCTKMMFYFGLPAFLPMYVSCSLCCKLSFLGSFHLLQYQFIGWVQSICCF